MQGNFQKYLAEALGTFALVLIAAGSVLANAQTGSLGTLGVAMAHALGIAAVLYTVWHISGGHLNPAVTVSLWATGHVKTLTAVFYIIAQLVGAVVAALLLNVMFGSVSPQFYIGDTSLGAGVTPAVGILVEAVFTFLLVWTVFATMVDKKAANGFGALAVGLIIGVGVLISMNLTGGALNPARSFGPALVSSHWENHYVYWIGPLIGGLVAGFLYHFSFLKKD